MFNGNQCIILDYLNLRFRTLVWRYSDGCGVTWRYILQLKWYTVRLLVEWNKKSSVHGMSSTFLLHCGNFCGHYRLICSCSCGTALVCLSNNSRKVGWCCGFYICWVSSCTSDNGERNWTFHVFSLRFSSSASETKRWRDRQRVGQRSHSPSIHPRSSPIHKQCTSTPSGPISCWDILHL